MSDEPKPPEPFIAGHINVSEHLLREAESIHSQLDLMIMDELSGRPWKRTRYVYRQTPRERVRQVREALARWIAPWAMYDPRDDD